MFKKNENVIYVIIKKAIVEEIHYDDAPNLYYTIKILNTDKINQTVEKNMKLIKKNGKINPFDKKDLILYIKNVKTNIYDIKHMNEENLYKIKIGDKYKFVNKDKLFKIS